MYKTVLVESRSVTPLCHPLASEADRPRCSNANVLKLTHLTVYAAAAAAGVCRRGGDLLVKLINPDAAKPAVDLEQKELVESLIKLLLGDQVSHMDFYPLARAAMVDKCGQLFFIQHDWLLVLTTVGQLPWALGGAG